MSETMSGPGNTEIITPSADSTSTSSLDQGQAAEPAVIDIPDENALIRVKGSDKPVKYGEHIKGFQSQFTKASQRAAQLERDLAVERARREAFEQERQRSAPQPGSNQPDIYEQLRQLPYLDGETTARVVQNIGQQFQQRDQVLLGLLETVKKLQGTVGGLNQSSVNSSFDSKINKWVADGGYPPEANELAKEIYLAYEGNDLDSEFPQIFANRWNQIVNLVEAQKRASLDRARKAPFVPGRGSVAGPSKPMQLDPRADARSVADQLWASMQESGT